MRLLKKTFHCAGIMSFDFAVDTDFDNLISILENSQKLTPAKVYGPGHMSGKVDSSIRVSKHIKNLIHLAKDNLPTLYPFITEIEDILREGSVLYMKRHKMYGLDAFDFLEVLKYTKGGKYITHIDQCGGDRECSAMLYLNDVEGGGETEFPFTYGKDGKTITIKPKRGRLLIFNCGHSMFHRGLPVTKGVKYAIYTFLCQPYRNEEQQELHERGGSGGLYSRIRSGGNSGIF